MNEGTNNRSPIKKLACAATSSAKQAKIKIKTASTFSCGTGLFFFCIIYNGNDFIIQNFNLVFICKHSTTFNKCESKVFDFDKN